MEITHVSLEEWESLLPASGVEVFHTRPALEVIDAHASGELRLLAGFKGETAVAMLPAFVREGPVGRVVFSPPPRMGVPRLGPVVAPKSPKRSKREDVTRRFVAGVVSELDADGPLSLVRMRCGLGFRDPRPFTWHGFGVEPAFTYVVDAAVPDMDALLAPFSSSLRRELRIAGDADLDVSLEGPAGAELVVEQVLDRYDEQDHGAVIDGGFVTDLVAALGERARVYVARDRDGSYLGGIVTLVSNDAVYYWQGGVGESYEETLADGTTRSVSVNALLHRTILQDILADPALEGVDRYDLVGANTQRLCAYKSKFGGSLEPYYVVESTGTATRLAKSGFQLLTRGK